MHLDLTEILHGPIFQVEKRFEIPSGTLKSAGVDDEWQLSEPVRGWVRASNARRNIVVRGHANCAVTLQCSRCLCDYSQPLEFDLDVTVPLSTFNKQLGAAAVADEEDDDSGQELTKEDIEALFGEHHLDVSELVRQAIVLSAPIQPLCNADCPGLPEAKAYSETLVDERWAALQTAKPNTSTPKKAR